MYYSYVPYSLRDARWYMGATSNLSERALYPSGTGQASNELVRISWNGTSERAVPGGRPFAPIPAGCARVRYSRYTRFRVVIQFESNWEV